VTALLTVMLQLEQPEHVQQLLVNVLETTR
jgi:hypothetical protein